MKRLFLLVPALVLAVAGSASAAEPAIQGPLCDPCVPAGLKNVPPAPATEGSALQAQVERKLRESFEVADVQRAGSLTRAQASAAGLGVVAKNFDRIDTAKTGKVTFEDLKRYLRSRGAKF